MLPPFFSAYPLPPLCPVPPPLPPPPKVLFEAPEMLPGEAIRTSPPFCPLLAALYCSEPPKPAVCTCPRVILPAPVPVPVASTVIGAPLVLRFRLGILTLPPLFDAPVIAQVVPFTRKVTPAAIVIA